MSSYEARDSSAKRSNSRTRTSRPTTPLRPSSRSSFRESARSSVTGEASFPLNTFEPAFAELSDAMADLEANMMHFQLMHESLSRFSESFASFMYGLNMNAFCVDFPEGPITESFRRAKQQEEQEQAGANVRIPGGGRELDGETTFMTTDTSFIENPQSSKESSRFQTPKARQSRVPAPTVSTRGGTTRGGTTGTTGTTRGGRGGTRGTRASGLARPRGRGIR